MFKPRIAHQVRGPFRGTGEGFCRSRSTLLSTLCESVHMAGTIRQRKPGVWQLRVSAGFDSAGRRRVITETFHGSEAAAGVRLALIVTNAARGSVPTSMTLGAVLDDHLAHGGLARSTVDKFTYGLKHLPPAWRKKRLDRITARDVQTLYRTLAANGVTASSVRAIHEVCRASVNQIVRLGDLERNPWLHVTAPPAPPSRAAAPDVDAINKLREHAHRNQLHGVWFELALMTGARRSEVLALRWSDLVGARLTINKAMESDGGLKSTKTNSTRIVSLPADTVATVKAWQFAQRHIAKQCKTKLVADPFIISSAPDGGESWRPSSATQLFDRLRKRAGLGSTVRLHDLRHAAASHLLANGVDAVAVAARLGHADPRTTLKIYGHVIEGRDAHSADVLSAAYAPVKKFS